ncbi:hypothetical protein [Terrihabitans rhizophilus]|jgi:hypothetical protein|uniref:Uncharacterized protein n=1 Tax=Terrihabitans rhizophilus TaxID=3092662 RepID=A0ABU4RKL7_9HYPH|nr:hypothetical protein [Terrihabitans sp. PJ23]MDX6805386.1 hypothetical protein [Terrihabitans sp. PJ23]
MNKPVAAFILVLLVAAAAAAYMNLTVSGELMKTLPPPPDAVQQRP